MVFKIILRKIHKNKSNKFINNYKEILIQDRLISSLINGNSNSGINCDYNLMLII